MNMTWSVTMTTNKKIKNKFFLEFIEMLRVLLQSDAELVSDLQQASLDDFQKGKKDYLYNGPPNMDTVKLDFISKLFLQYMKSNRKQKNFEQPKAVDAVCVNNRNEWFLIEFKNQSVCNKNTFDEDKNIFSDIKKKMTESLWLLFSMDSMSDKSVFPTDITEFARNHITYIIVISSIKNTREYHLIRQSPENHYTPNSLKKYIGYYCKDVYMITELELPKFIKNFKL